MTASPGEQTPPPIPEGLKRWDGSDGVSSVRAAWDRAEEHNAPGHLLHIWQSTLAGLVDETGGACPNETDEVSGPLCDCMTAVGHARDFLLRQGWTIFREKNGGDFAEYWLLPPGAPEE